MLQISCPWCGPRDETEYHYGGQAHVAYPEDPAALSDEEWAAYLFFRDNPKGLFAERWVHSTGCRKWFNALTDLYPCFSRLRMLRQWGGIVDTCPDASPIIGKTPVENLFINCGWGTGGFKATPGSGNVFAHTIARGEPHPLAVPFALERFTTGYLIDEHGAAGVAH